MCNGCNPTVVFSWLGGSLVNLAFLVLISWGSASLWPLGLVLCVLYTASLFTLGCCLRAKFPANATVGIAVNLVLLLATFGIGVSGLFLPINLLGCDWQRFSPPSADTWSTPTDGLSETVSRFALENSPGGATASMVTTEHGAYFAAFNGSAPVHPTCGPSCSAQGVWYSPAAASVPPDNNGPPQWWPDPGPPQLLSGRRLSRGDTSSAAVEVTTLLYPRALVAVEPRVPHCCRHTDDGTALVGGVGRCWKEQSTCPHACMLVDAYTASGTSEVSLACASYADLVLVDAPEAGDRGFGWVQDLLVDDGHVWFKSQPPDGSSFYPPGGVLWRADPATLTATLVSRRVGDEEAAPPPPRAPGYEPAPACDEAAGVRAQALGALFLATLPMLTVAIILWVKKPGVPSMPFATFAGASALVVNLYTIIEPSGKSLGDVLRWWFTSFSIVWLALMLALHASQRLPSDAVSWAVNVGAVGFFGAMHAQLKVPVEDLWWQWLLYNLLCIIPLLAYAIASSRAMPLVLGAAGLFLDAFRLSSLLADLTSDTTAQVLIRFLVLGVTGVLVVVAGLAYHRFSKQVEAWADGVLARVFGGLRPKGSEEPAKVVETAA